MWTCHLACAKRVPIKDDDFVFFVIENSVLIRQTADFEQTAFVNLLHRKRMRKTEDKFPLAAMGENPNPSGLVLTRGVNGHTSGASGDERACVGRGGGDATERRADSREKGVEGRLRGRVGQRG